MTLSSPSGRFELVRTGAVYRVADLSLGTAPQPAELMRARSREDAVALMAYLEAHAYPRQPVQASLPDGLGGDAA